MGLALGAWLHPETWRRRRRRRLGVGGGGSWGPWRWPGVSRRQLAEARGGSGGALSAGSPSSLTLRLCLFLSSGAGLGRPSVPLLPVRRESAAADTRREYVRARLCRDYRRGTLHSFRQVFALAWDALPRVLWQISACGDLTAVGLILRAESGSLCILMSPCYGLPLVRFHDSFSL